MRKCRAMCEHYGLPVDSLSPKTIEGVEKPIGVWDCEGTYTMFKTLGAKRYMTLKDGKLSLTVAGLNKKAAVPYLLETYGSVANVFAHFSNTLQVPPNHTGKLLHSYIDEPYNGCLVDYMGKAAPYKELSSLHLEPTGYTLAIGLSYLLFIQGMREGKR